MVQEFKADLLFGDWGYFCTPALSEVLQVPRVTVSNIPIVDPIHTTWDRSTGRRMHVPNMLAYTPQVSKDSGEEVTNSAELIRCSLFHI